MVHNAVHCV